MRYYWKKQKPKTSLCGQIAVSIILRKPLKEVIKMFGKDCGTWTKDLVRVLRKNKIKCGKKLERTRKSNLAIAKLTYPHKKIWHWVVVHNNKIYDGIWGKSNGTVDWSEKKGRLTSYLNIKENPPSLDKSK